MKTSNRDKIAILHWGFPPIIGGVETHLSLLGPGLSKKGYKVTILTGNVSNHNLDYEYEGIRVKRSPLFDLNWLFERGFGGLEEDIKNLIDSFLDNLKPDIIHAHNMHYFSRLHAETIEAYATKNKIPLILTAHNVWDEPDFLDLTLDIKWNHIIAVSQYIKSELIGIGVPENKITIVSHGIDIDRFTNIDAGEIFKKFPTLKNRKIILHPARLGLGTGCDVSVKALKIIKNSFPEILLILTGTKNIIDWGTTQQKDIAYILALAKRLKVEMNLFIEMMPHNLMPQLYKIADVCIYPSSSQVPFGITILESLAAGIPMVVTDSGSMPEIIKDGINGLVVKIKNYRQLANRCLLLLKDENLRRELGEEGRKMIKEKYIQDIMIENTLKVYKKASL